MNTQILSRIVTCLFIVLCSFYSFSKNIYVNDVVSSLDVYCTASGSSSNDGLTSATPKANLTQALSVAVSGDIIYVDAGSYIDSKIVLSKDNISIIGAGSSNTLFSQNSSGTLNYFMRIYNRNNITFKNIQIGKYSNGTSFEGEAITIDGSTNILFDNVVLAQNRTSAGEASVVINNNSTVTFEGLAFSCQGIQSGLNGGGIDVKSSTDSYSKNVTLNINNSLITGNDRTGGGTVGGGMIISGDNTVFVNITNSTFYNNKAQSGGGIFIEGGVLNVSNTLFESNTAVGSGSNNSYGGAIMFSGTSSTLKSTIKNCKFLSNKSTNGFNFGGAISFSGQQVIATNAGAAHSNLVDIIDCEFASNISGSGKGTDIYSKAGKTNTVFISNTTFAGASTSVYNTSGSLTLVGCNNPNPTTFGSVTMDLTTRNSVTAVTTPTIGGNCPSISVCNPAKATATVAGCDSTAILTGTAPAGSVFYWYDNLADATTHASNNPKKWLDTSSTATPDFVVHKIYAIKTYYVVSNLDGCSTPTPVIVTYNCPTCTTTLTYDPDSVCVGNTSILTPSITNSTNPTPVFSITPINAGSTAALNTATGKLDLSKITYDTTYTITMAEGTGCNPKFNIVVVKQVSKPSITVTQATCTKNGFAIINNYDSKLIYTATPSTGVVFKGDSIKASTSGSFTIRASNSVCYADSLITFNAVPGKPVLSGAGEICVDSTINLKAWTDITLTIPSSPNTLNPWVSSDPSVATVLSTGVVTGKKGGTITITYTDVANCTQTASIQVDPKAVGGTATPNAADLCSGTNTIINLSGYTGKIQWQSSPDGLNNWTNILPLATTTPFTTPTLTPGTYYYRALVTSGVCSATATSTVAKITVSPTPVIGSVSLTPDTICVGSTTTLKLTGSVGNIQWKESLDGLTSWNNITGTPDGNLPICGTAQLVDTMYYKAVLSSGACASVESTVLKVVVIPITNASVSIDSDPKPTAGELTICPDTKVVFTATPSLGLGKVSYQWKNKGINISSAIKATYTTQGLKDGDSITCEMKTLDGKCITGSPAISNLIKVKVLVKDFVVKGIGPNSCNKLDGKVYVQGTGIGTVKWSLQATPSVVIGTHPGITLTKSAPFDTIIGLGKGLYTVTFNNGTCEFSQDILLQDPNAPKDPLLSVSTTLPICQGQSVIITANVPNPTTLTTKYHWRKNGSDFNGAQPQDANFITVNSQGTYSVTLVDGTCSSNEYDTTITITPTPSDIIVSDPTPIFCKENGKLVSDLKQLTTNLTQTITWYDVNGNAYGDGDVVITGDYYAEQSFGACKSTNRTKVHVTIIDLAKPFLPGNNKQPSCSVATGTVEINMPKAGVWDITATPVVGSPTKVTTDNLTANPFTYSFVGLNPGSYTFKIKDVNGCVSPNSNSVVIDNQPTSPLTPVLDGTKVYCASKSYTLDQITFSPAPTGTVNYYDANDVLISGKTVVAANTIYKFAFYNGTCESKLKLATSISLDKGPTLIPLVDLSTSLLICAIDKPTFNSIIANSPITLPGGYSILISQNSTGNPVIPNTTQIASKGGVTQTFYYNIQDNNECQSSTFATLKFKLNEGPTDLVLKNPKVFCATDNPTNAKLDETKISGTGVLKWFASETSTSVLPSDMPLVSGTYFASATLTPGCESVVRKSVDVSIQSFGQTILDPSNDYTFCAGSNKTIKDLEIKPYFLNEIVWLNSYKVVQTPSTPLIQGTYYAAETKNGCVSQNMQEIIVNFKSPVISISPSKLPTCSAGNGALFIIGADPSYTYQWSKNGQLMTETGSSITNLPDDQAIKYSVIVTDSKKCIAKDTTTFTDCDPAAIPHIITPNGDGKNDKFVLNYESKYPKCQLYIFNRWGSIVYETKDAPYKDDWDGKPNVGATLGSNVLPAGTYFYMVDKGDGTTPESGYVELVK